MATVRSRTAGACSPATPWTVGSEVGLHEREHREDAAVVVVPGREAQLSEDRAHVLLHGALCDDQALADRLVGAALGDQLEPRAPARRQRSQPALLSGIR